MGEGVASGAVVAPAQGRAAIRNEGSEVGPKAGAGRARSDGREGRLRWGPSAQRIQRTLAVVHGSNSGQAHKVPHTSMNAGMGTAQPDGGAGDAAAGCRRDGADHRSCNGAGPVVVEPIARGCCAALAGGLQPCKKFITD